MWCFASFLLVCFSFSFLWQAKPNIVSNLVIPCGPFGGTSYYPTRKYRAIPQQGCHFKTSSSMFRMIFLSFQDRYIHHLENHPGPKNPNRNAEMPANSICSGCFQPFFGGEPQASPWWPPGFSHGRRNALLLFGPMGSGKRSLAEAAAAEAGAQARSGPGTSGHLVLVIGEIDLRFFVFL